jgi:hypothetical protein
LPLPPRPPVVVLGEVWEAKAPVPQRFPRPPRPPGPFSATLPRVRGATPWHPFYLNYTQPL